MFDTCYLLAGRFCGEAPEAKDLTTGDGLGLPICRQMALKMDGDLEIDPEYTKGTRFVLSLHA